jgi:molybdopterin-guanine dinucleotide biosynthesis protein A
VLVGGRSSRMGRDKALLPFRGGSLAQWTAGLAAQAAGKATLVGPPERYADLGFRVIPDLFPREGPLGGIITALRDSSSEWNLILACDMPEIGAPLLTRLMDLATQSGADVLLPLTVENRPEPLCAVYRRACLPALETAFAGGVRKVTAALEAMRTLRLPVEEVAQFQNVNTPEDWAGYAAR